MLWSRFAAQIPQVERLLVVADQPCACWVCFGKSPTSSVRKYRPAARAKTSFAALPDTFPQTKRYAAELTSGAGHERFDFTIRLMIDGLVRG